MKYYDKVQLKNGSECLLRSPNGNDARSIIDHMIMTSGETDFMLRYPDEFKLTTEDEFNYLNKIEASKDSMMICAVVDGKIVANAGFSPVLPYEKCKHRAELGISIQKQYWGMGIGSQILVALIEEARHAGYEQMELDVVSSNARAIALYEKIGFCTYGNNAKAFKCRDGSYQDLILMSYRLV